jgi:hypothetical protein
MSLKQKPVHHPPYYDVVKFVSHYNLKKIYLTVEIFQENVLI